MPAYVAPFLGFALGALLAWARVDDRAADRGEAARQLGLVVLFALGVFAPIAGYFLVFEGDWAYGYFVDSRRVPSAVDLGLCLLDAAVVPVGFWLTRARLMARSVSGAVAMLAAPTALALAVVVALGSRVTIAATFAQFEGSYGLAPLSGSALGLALLWMNAILIAGVLLAVRWLRRPSESVVPADPEPTTTPLPKVAPTLRRSMLLRRPTLVPAPRLPRPPSKTIDGESAPRLLGRPRLPR